MKTNEALKILKDAGIKMSDPINYYDESQHKQRCHVIGCGLAEGITEYGGLPMLKPRQGFRIIDGVIRDFFIHDGKDFLYFNNINDFILNLK